MYVFSTYGKWSSIIYLVTTPNLLMYYLYLNLICRNFFLSQNNIFIPIHVVPLHDFTNSSYTTCRFENHYVVSQFDPILNMRYINHYVVSILIRLKKNESKNRNSFVFRIMCRRWRWDKLNGYFNFSTANFFRITKPIENSKESMIAELQKTLFYIINTSYSQRKKRTTYF